MTYLNAQTKNIGNNEGDVLSFFQNKVRNLIQRNGGDNSFSFVMEEFTNKDAPMPVGTKTRCFICYIDLKDIADGNIHKFTIELTIPFVDQLALQAWQLYPNAICGEIEEEVKTSLRAMVWCMVNPNVIKETLQFLEDTVIDEELPSVVPISRKFTQIGKPSVIVSHYSSSPTPSQTLHIKNQRISGGKPYTANDPTRDDNHDDESEPIAIDFHYTTDDFTKYEVDESLINHAEFPELIAAHNKDYPLNAGDSIKIIESDVKGALLVKSSKLNGSSINLKTEKLTLDVLTGTIQLGRSNLAGFGLKHGTYQGLINELH